MLRRRKTTTEHSDKQHITKTHKTAMAQSQERLMFKDSGMCFRTGSEKEIREDLRQ